MKSLLNKSASPQFALSSSIFSPSRHSLNENANEHLFFYFYNGGKKNVVKHFEKRIKSFTIESLCFSELQKTHPFLVLLFIWALLTDPGGHTPFEKKLLESEFLKLTQVHDTRQHLRFIGLPEPPRTEVLLTIASQCTHDVTAFQFSESNFYAIFHLSQPNNRLHIHGRRSNPALSAGKFAFSPPENNPPKTRLPPSPLTSCNRHKMIACSSKGIFEWSFLFEVDRLFETFHNDFELNTQMEFERIWNERVWGRIGPLSGKL